MVDLILHSGAAISPCGQYRPWLERIWDRKRPPMILNMLNPSTADHRENDPTIRRGIGFAQREKCGGLIVVNANDLRATDPRELLRHPEPCSPLNARAIGDALALSASIGAVFVCAWGSHSAAQAHARRLPMRAKDFGVQLWCLVVTKDGSPRHPLYLPKDAPLMRWPAKESDNDG